jgi:hypothetical protein
MFLISAFTKLTYLELDLTCFFRIQPRGGAGRKEYHTSMIKVHRSHALEPPRE